MQEETIVKILKFYNAKNFWRSHPSDSETENTKKEPFATLKNILAQDSNPHIPACHWAIWRENETKWRKS